MSGEPFIVSRVARQLIIEFGEGAAEAASIFSEECRNAANLEGELNWKAVKDALLCMKPGAVSKIKAT